MGFSVDESEYRATYLILRIFSMRSDDETPGRDEQVAKGANFGRIGRLLLALSFCKSLSYLVCGALVQSGPKKISFIIRWLLLKDARFFRRETGLDSVETAL